VMEKRDGYKKTKIGWIPEGWDLKKIGDLFELSSGKTPSRKKTNYYSLGTIPWVKTADLNNSYIKLTDERITEVAAKECSMKILPRQTVLIAMYGGFNQIGRTGILGVPAATNQAMTALLPNKENSSEFLNYYLITFRNNWRDVATSSRKDPNITKKDVQNFYLRLPPLTEQKKIASILTTVDDKISSIENQIQQTEQLKKGLMEKLLTEGIGHTEFKDTKIGRIPEAWDVVNINTVSVRKSGHTPNRKIPEYWNGGIKWVSLADSFRLDTRYLNETEYNISEAGIDNSSAVKLEEGTVIISRDAGIGKSTIINEEMAVSQHFIAWKCSDTLFNLFLFYLLQKWKPKFERIANGTTIKTIGLDFFKKMVIPLPPIEEQEQIATILSTVDDKIEILNQKKSQYQTLKKGLSQQLLTGQMRVKI